MGTRGPDFRDAFWVKIIHFSSSLTTIIRYPPFYDNEPIGIYKKIVTGIIEFPTFFNVKAKHLIIKLLNPEINYRLGVNSV